MEACQIGWRESTVRHLLEESSSAELRKKADLVVAKDGSGKYKTIGAALKAVPDKSTKTTIIYVKAGVFTEYVVVEKSKWNVVFVGDGMDATTVAGGKNVVDGTPTFDTAPFAVMGKGLVARDMGFRNTAGAAKHQAVAMRSSGDFSVFYRCKFDAFQDTLYTHANRQFYRECLITGTIDFIFGNSAAVFQNCNIQPRPPMNGQKNTITAQGNLIHPKGWLPWTGTSAPSTIFYAECQNSGPGSNTQNRVKWKGLRTITASVANKFTVDSFISGSTWISAAGVPFKGGL
uniref:Pectinesterase n=1 Tax=Kalanchoe fedtschenkoi TaxID=63787 RepID=A0A7N0T623_KALFE